MARSPFTKKSSSKQSPRQGQPRPKLSNDTESLQARAARRRRFDISHITFEVNNRASNGKFQRSLSYLAEKFEHHQTLLKQLLFGAGIYYAKRHVTYQTQQNAYYGIEDFVKFLNSEKGPEQKKISTVADIDFQTTRNFSAYLLERFSGRTSNRKIYSSLKHAVSALQEKYKDEPSIGKKIEWSLTPRTSDTPSESYSDQIFNRLLEASFTDIKYVMKLMTDYQKLISDSSFDLPSKLKITKDGIVNRNTREQSNSIILLAGKKTFPGWPLYTSFDEASQITSNEWMKSLPVKDVKRQVSRAIASMRVQCVNSDISKKNQVATDFEVGKIAYIAHDFFTTQTLYPFILFVQLNTGWNQETVLSLTDDFETHVAEDLVDPDQYVLIYGTKNRTETAQAHRSNKVHPYSVYNVLRFVSERVRAHKESPHFRTGFLWQVVIQKNLWNKYGSLITEIDAKNCGAASRVFLSRHSITLDGDAKSPAIESRRLRTTWETKRKEQGLSIGEISPMMGHANLETTVTYYDSDSGCTSLRNKSLRKLQNQWTEDFTNYGVRLATSIALSDLRNATNLANASRVKSRLVNELKLVDEQQIIHLLSPQGQTFIVACLDSKKPSWEGHERFVSESKRCSFFNRCCMCRQAVIFREALPFIARRVDDLIRLKSRLNVIEWTSNYGDELAAWEQILNQWNPQEQVLDAKVLAKNDVYALPLTMRGSNE